MEEPDFADAVFGKPVDSLLQLPDPRMRGKHFEHHIGHADDSFLASPPPRMRDEHEIGLQNQRAVPIEDDVERRQQHPAQPTLSDVRRKRQKKGAQRC